MAHIKERLEKQQEYQEKLAKQRCHKSDVELQSEAKDLLVMLMSRLYLPHFHKLMWKLEEFTKFPRCKTASKKEGMMSIAIVGILTMMG